MIFVKTFKGYEDKTMELDQTVNDWVRQNSVRVKSIQTALSHEQDGRAKMGDLIYTIIYDAEAPIA